MITISKVIIENFKIYTKQEFNFMDNKIILLTGANGFGKTTLFDAIEWCLTGNISRVKKLYEERNTTQTEKTRKENSTGIIKNSNCKAKDIVKVILTLKINNEYVEIFRKQVEDTLYAKTKLEFQGDVSDKIKIAIENLIVSDTFYKYHICDTYKSFEFLNNSRKDVKNEFEDFLKGRSEVDLFVNKLNELQIETDNQIEKIEKTNIKQDIINNIIEELNSIKSKLKLIDYPQILFYENENLKIEKENLNMIRQQLDSLKTCGYNIVYSKIDDIIKFYMTKENNNKVDELIGIIDVKESDLNIAIKNSFYDMEKLETLKKTIRDIKDEKKKLENAKHINDIEIEAPTKPEIYSDEIINDINKYTDEIRSIVDKLRNKQQEIKAKENGNEIITALSNLVVSRDAIIKYKNDGNNNSCPLCGSEEKFSVITQATELAVIAEDYLKKSESDLANMKGKEQEINNNITTKFGQFKQFIIKYLDEKLKKFEDKNLNFNKVYTNTKEFFDKLKKINIPIDENTIDNVKKNKIEITESYIDLTKYNFEMIKKILILLEYNLDFDDISIDALKKIKLDLTQLQNENFLVSNFTFDAFNQKLLYINNILNSSLIREKEEQIKKYNDFNTKNNNEVVVLKEYKEKAKKIHDDIERKRAELEKLELHAVGPYLYSIFTKVIKHTVISPFQFKRDGSRVSGGATITDLKGNNILNILSQGQIGVFMLSYFFANMFKRKEETDFKTYFVDDITSCMDDINVLSFVDIIKYQLYRKDTVINQFFFATCDDNLEKLFIHKMKSFEIEWINFKFNSYARGAITNYLNGSQDFGN